MNFSDLVPGLVVDCGSYEVSAAEIQQFARRYDPQPFHIDAPQAQRSRWGGLIASGFHTCSIAMRLVALRVLHESNSCGSPGLDYVKWKEPVRPGDTLRVRFIVLTSRVASSRAVGIVRARWEVLNQHDREVMELLGVSMFELPDRAAPAPASA